MPGVVRTLAFALALTATATATVSGMFKLGRWAHPERLSANLMVMLAIPGQLKRLQIHGRNPQSYTVAFLGDSTVMSYPEGKTVDDRLQKILTSEWIGSDHIHVESLSSLGMAPAGFFLLQDEINLGKPDIAIVTANLTFLRDPLPPRFQKPELAGWVHADRLDDTLITLDMYKYGVTADRLLLYKLFVETDLAGHWLMQMHRQAYLGELRAATESAIAKKTGWTGETATNGQRGLRKRAEVLLPTQQPRLNPVGAERQTAEMMSGIDDGHWMVETLEAMLRDFAEAGTRTVLYVPPINIEHLQKVGAYDKEGLRQTLRTLERIALATDAEFADLHDLLPDAAFRDSGGHLTYEPPLDGPMLVAQALAPYVIIQAREVDPLH